jgi:hypothetical protein
MQLDFAVKTCSRHSGGTEPILAANNVTSPPLLSVLLHHFVYWVCLWGQGFKHPDMFNNSKSVHWVNNQIHVQASTVVY